MWDPHKKPSLWFFGWLSGLYIEGVRAVRFLVRGMMFQVLALALLCLWIVGVVTLSVLLSDYVPIFLAVAFFILLLW